MVRIDQNDLMMSGYCSLYVTENLAGNGIHSLATINLLELEVAFSIASAFKGSNSSNKMSLCCTKKSLGAPFKDILVLVSSLESRLFTTSSCSSWS